MFLEISVRRRKEEIRPSVTAALLGTILFVWAGLGAGTATATEVEIFRQDQRAEALEGEVDAASVGADGELRLAPLFERLAGLDEPFLFSAAPDLEGGAVLGTGAAGKIFHVDAEGVPKPLGALEQPSVFAVHVTRSGTVLAAGSPEGALHRMTKNGAVEEIFDPEATYIWDLAEDRDGRVLVATGLPGRVYRLSADLSSAETLYESPDRHVRTLLPRADGSLILGTAGQGLIVRLGADGEARTLYDAAEPEVLAFAERGGVLYAALLASEASQVDLSALTGQSAEASGQDTVGSRASSYEGPRSRILALEEGRSPRVVAELADKTVHALASVDGELWIGTGQEGGLYRLEREELVLEKRFEESQIMALMPASSALLLATTDSVALYRHRGARARTGTFTSQIFDAEHAARFGVLRWWGEERGGDVRFEVRSGMAAKPDATWTEWQAVDGAPGDGLDVDLGPKVGVARYVQWRATLEAGGDGARSPRVDIVELSYRQLNQPPTLGALEVLDAGEILVSTSFNPTSTTFEPWSPNRDGIFTRLRPEKSDGQLKTLWKRGYRTLRFEAADPNGDELRYRIEVRRAGEADDDAWLTVVEDLEESWLSFDSTVLPDGHYRFRVTATDAPANPHDETLSERLRSEPVIIDHTPPRLVETTKRGARLELEVADALHPIRDAVYSVDAGAWQPATSADGLLDSRRERLVIEPPADARLVLLRLTDAALNVVTFEVDQP